MLKVNMNREKIDSGRTATLGLYMLAAVALILGFSLLIWGDAKMLATFKDYAAFIVPLFIGQLFISRQNNDIREKLASTSDAPEWATTISGRLDTIETRLTALENNGESRD